MAPKLYLVRARAPGAVLWEQVGGVVADAAGAGRATAEIVARQRHAEAEGRGRVVVVEQRPGEASGRLVLDLPAAPWGTPAPFALP